ncbi:hypothetical protein RJ641_015018 [Dillenia turbinata]|uniref:Uncharacterized protein n=1 Tax=Dillenia turbinata TaxID=194707 RepID=A0AAN8USR7_9MAGN
MISNGVALKFVSSSPNPLFQSQFLNRKKAHFETGRPLKIRIRGERVTEIRVCVNRTCRRQGSFETLEVLSGVSPPNIAVKSCGCLGRCGAGPNLVVLPNGVFIGHCGTAAKAAQVLMDFCGLSTSEEASNCLAALALRKKAEEEFLKGNFSDSELLLTQIVAILEVPPYDDSPYHELHFGQYHHHALSE